MIITIDGPSGTGKSTIAKLLAQKLKFIHVDTGAMYRTVTYAILKYDIPLKDHEGLQKLLNHFDFTIKIIEGKQHFFFEGEDVSKQIREPLVTSLVSEVSTLSVVRKNLVELQRHLGTESAVFEGRDMGTVVFPEAKIKIFLTAKAEIRAERRLKEMPQENHTLETVLESLKSRDHIDSTRDLSPLKAASDATIIDTSNLTIDEVLDKILRIYNTLDSL